MYFMTIIVFRQYISNPFAVTLDVIRHAFVYETRDEVPNTILHMYHSI